MMILDKRNLWFIYMKTDRRGPQMDSVERMDVGCFKVVRMGGGESDNTVSLALCYLDRSEAKKKYIVHQQYKQSACSSQKRKPSINCGRQRRRTTKAL